MGKAYPQASKRKRKRFRTNRALSLNTLCIDCGKKIKKREMHHVRCGICWRKKYKSTKDRKVILRGEK